jgi:hypothetical protein
VLVDGSSEVRGPDSPMRDIPLDDTLLRQNSLRPPPTAELFVALLNAVDDLRDQTYGDWSNSSECVEREYD